MYQFNLVATTSYMSLLPQAMLSTIWLSLLGILLSLVVGVAGALCRTSTSWLLRLLGGVYVRCSATSRC